MTQEEKNLLLVAICSYLPYGLKMQDSRYNTEMIKTISFEDNVEQIIDAGWKPYLRPMKSMTEEEDVDYRTICWGEEYYTEESCERIDWLNSKKFDYRGLIEKGLAIEAPEDMYKI